VRIPDEVAVIGFDDIEDAAFAHPTLTSVDPGRLQIARDAVQLLIERIAEGAKPPVERRPVQRILADYHVVERESTALASA
jgi:DNA-binding LacI/PurR family transcriptional regulator